MEFAFVHINKTGGSSIEKALGLPFRHRTARELIRELGEDAWRARFTFTVVRNPWDRVVSHYAYRVQTNQTGLADAGLDFGDWVREAYARRNRRYRDKPRMFMPQSQWICDRRGNVLVDHVARFENLAAEFDDICGRIGRRAALPHVKRSTHGDYRDYYDDESRAIIAQCFRADIDRFSYRF